MQEKAGLGPKRDYYASQNVILNAGGDVGVQNVFEMVKFLLFCSFQPKVEDFQSWSFGIALMRNTYFYITNEIMA